MTFIPEMLFITITLWTLAKQWLHSKWDDISTKLKTDPKSIATRLPCESDEESTTEPPGLTPCESDEESSTSLEDLISRPHGIIIDAPFRYWGDNDDDNYDNNDGYDNYDNYDGFHFYEDLWNDYDDTSDYNSQEEDLGYNPDYQSIWHELLDNFRNQNRQNNSDSPNHLEPPED